MENWDWDRGRDWVRVKPLHEAHLQSREGEIVAERLDVRGCTRWQAAARLCAQGQGVQVSWAGPAFLSWKKGMARMRKPGSGRKSASKIAMNSALISSCTCAAQVGPRRGSVPGSRGLAS